MPAVPIASAARRRQRHRTVDATMRRALGTNFGLHEQAGTVCQGHLACLLDMIAGIWLHGQQ